MEYTPFDGYLDAVERAVGFPYAEVIVSVVQECFADGWSVEACADRLITDAEEAAAQ